MHAIQFDGKFTDQQEFELIRQEMNLSSLQPIHFMPSRAALARAGEVCTHALMVFKGALMVGGVALVVLTLALQAATRF